MSRRDRHGSRYRTFPRRSLCPPCTQLSPLLLLCTLYGYSSSSSDSLISSNLETRTTTSPIIVDDVESTSEMPGTLLLLAVDMKSGCEDERPRTWLMLVKRELSKMLARDMVSRRCAIKFARERYASAM